MEAERMKTAAQEERAPQEEQPPAMRLPPRLTQLDQRKLALLGLAVAVVTSAALLISVDSHLTFISDDWELLIKRHGWSPGVFLDPFHENIVFGPAVLYKLLLAIFGMGSALPFHLVSVSLFLASAVLLFVYLRRRVGDWPALIGAIAILFLGAAFEDLLWAFQMGYFASMAAGLGMLLALDRSDRRGDRIACVLLVASLAFSSLGLVFAAGALADLVLSRRPRARRAYVVLGPLALFAVWWLGWGRNVESHLSFHNLEYLPSYVFSAAGAGITSLLGLATGGGGEPSQPHLIWGKALLVVAIALAAVRVARQGRVSPGLAVALTIGLSFWVLAGLNRNPERFPTSSRYQYPSAVFLLLITAETLRGLRLPRLGIALAAAVTGAALAGGLSLLHHYAQRWERAADTVRSSLAAVDIAGASTERRLTITFRPSVTVPARAYLAAAREHGSPAFTEAELEARPQVDRKRADLTLAKALGLRLSSPGRPVRTASCRALRASAGGHTGLALPHGSFTLVNETSAPVEVLLSRFSEGFSVGLGPLPAGVESALTIPADNSSRPWNLGLRGEGPVRLCTTRPA
jgi:hypothetical protein